VTVNPSTVLSIIKQISIDGWKQRCSALANTYNTTMARARRNIIRVIIPCATRGLHNAIYYHWGERDCNCAYRRFYSSWSGSAAAADDDGHCRVYARTRCMTCYIVSSHAPLLSPRHRHRISRTVHDVGARTAYRGTWFSTMRRSAAGRAVKPAWQRGNERARARAQSGLGLVGTTRGPTTLSVFN